MSKKIDDKDLVDVTGGTDDNEPLTPVKENDQFIGNTGQIVNMRDEDNESGDGVNQPFHE